MDRPSVIFPDRLKPEAWRMGFNKSCIPCYIIVGDEIKTEVF